MHNDSINKLIRNAEKGDTHAQVSLAARYATGDCVEKDLDKAVHWYRKAAEKFDCDAIYNLALMYLFGEGVGVDEKLALQMLSEAATYGSSDACLVLADASECGKYDMCKDIDEAIRRYVQAALLGSVLGVRGISRILKDEKVDLVQLAVVLDKF